MLSIQTQSPSFGNKYAYQDIMALMSGTHVTGREESIDRTAVKILKKALRKNPNKRYLDNIKAREILEKTHKEWIPLAQRFRAALSKISFNHFSITREDAAMVAKQEAKKFGNEFVEIG